jgi:hypothetical protein
MNDQQQPCEIWLEAISLLAAECLTGSEESTVQNHLAGCQACRVRYEEIAAVCAHVQMAQPAVEQERVLAVGRCLQQLQPPAEQVAQRTRSVPWRVALLASAALVLIALFGRWAWQRGDQLKGKSSLIVLAPPQLAPVESADQQLPTMFALRRAAAESEESLDRALARYSEPSLLEPLHHRTFNLESMQ